jgi:hypothetical protein
MAGVTTSGFDAVYQIAIDRLLAALDALFAGGLRAALRALPIAIDATHTGTIDYTNVSFSSLAAGSGNACILTVSVGRSTLTISGPLGVGLPPTEAGTTDITIPLSITTATSGSQSPVRIDVDTSRQVTMTPLTLLPSPLPTGLTPAMVQGAVSTATVRAVQTVFPVTVPVFLPVAPAGACPIFPRDLKVKFLGPDAQHQRALAFAVTMLSGTSGNLGTLTTSTLPLGGGAALTIRNGFLLEVLCCAFSHSSLISGLPPQPDHDDGHCCVWDAAVRRVNLSGQAVDLTRLAICVDPGAINVSGSCTQSGTGWWVDVSFSLSVGLSLSSGSIVPTTLAPPVVNATSHLEWWVYLIEAIVAIVAGILTFWLAGGAIGASVAVGAFVALVLAGVDALLLSILNALGGAVGGALGVVGNTLAGAQVVPADVLKAFGTIEPTALVFDDVALTGRCRVAGDVPARAQSGDLTIVSGAPVDLDNGQVGAPTDVRVDVAWGVAAGQPAILPQNGARLVALAHASFTSLTAADLRTFVYPVTATPILAGSLPVSATPDPAGAVVMAIRTSEGRFGKASAWRDAAGQLHLHYLTFDTAVAIELQADWEQIAGLPLRFPLVRVHWTGTVTAVPGRALQAPISYTWSWNDQALGSSGLLPTGDSYTVTNNTISITTRAGLLGRLCVQAVDTTGFQAEACADIDLPAVANLDGGLELLREERIPAVVEGRTAGDAPVEHTTLARPHDVPALGTLNDQLAAALEAGMG